MRYSVALKNNVLLWRRSPRHRTLDLMNRTISIKYVITYFECIYYLVNDREKTDAGENKCNNIGNILKDNSFESGLINLVCHVTASGEDRWNLIFLFLLFSDRPPYPRTGSTCLCFTISAVSGFLPTTDSKL